MQNTEEIKSRLDIVDVLSEYISLKQVGANFKALCPFHKENTPSFVVNQEKQIWHCFGCAKGGDIFSFLMEIEAIEFVEALKILAKKAGITLKVGYKQSNEKLSKKGIIFDILEETRNFYFYNLLNSKDKIVINYLKERGLDKDTISYWKIGYSKDSWNDLFLFLKKKKFLEKDIQEAGLIIKKENSFSKYYDRFRDRLMFPICDFSGNVIGFSARILPEKEDVTKQGKYINSPQSLVYNKSEVLFGIEKAKFNIKDKDYIIVVEGQMDVITAHKCGVDNVVASSGTTLSNKQLKIIKRYTKNIYFAFDMDNAGQAAIERGAKEAMHLDMNVKIVELPNGKDPDECIKNDLDEFYDSIKKAKNIMEYFFSKYVDNCDLKDISLKREVVKNVLNVIIFLINDVERDYWIKKLSEKLEIDEYIIREILDKINSNKKNLNKNKDVQDTVSTNIPISREEKLEENFLALIIRFDKFIPYTIDNFSIDFFSSDKIKFVYNELLIYYNKLDFLDKSFYQEFYNYFCQKYHKYSLFLDRLFILGQDNFSQFSKTEIKKEFFQLLIEIKKNYFLKKRKKLEKGIFQAEKENNNKKLNQLISELNLLNQKVKNI